jgi:hypothetical protein
MKAWLDRNRWPVGAFVLALVVYGVIAGQRLRRGSTDPHFVVQADAWLHGRLDVGPWPAGADDPARVETVELDTGEKVRGRRIASTSRFRTTDRREVPITRIKQSLGETSYVSFPSFPALLLVPQALLFGRYANDVALTVLLAALAPALLLLVLRRLREAGLSSRTQAQDAWLALLLAFGSVLFYSAVQGRVWFTAHVVGVVLALVYAWASVEAARPLVAGVALGLAFLTRTPMLFMFPLFLFEAWRCRKRELTSHLVKFALPVLVLGLAGAWYNWARFGDPFEFGHSYLVVRQQAQIERYGLFDWRYLGRNLAVALTLLPEISLRAPYVSISGHGLAVWFTTPALLLVLWPRHKGPLHRSLWITVGSVAVWSLLYQNSGWLQFGYRFSLDYLVFLVLLLAVGGRSLSRSVQALIVVGVVVNLFGAITFHRMPRHYRTDNSTYGCVVPH